MADFTEKCQIMADLAKFLWICITTLQFADSQTSFKRNHKYKKEQPQTDCSIYYTRLMTCFV